MKLAELFSLDDTYSTTRRVKKNVPKFNGALLYPEHVVQGGLRTRGLFKYSEKDKPLITIVTVVYNGADFLEKTIKSVLGQTYDNVEYIVVDGGSTDGTIDILNKYCDQIDYYISKSDCGIYDAMNTGIELSSGVWINFMNAGDGFLEMNVIEKVFEKNSFCNIDFIYGNHFVIYGDGRERKVIAGNVENLWKGSQFCHQAVFSKSEYLKSHFFDIHCGTVADFKLFYEARKLGATFEHIKYFICRYSAGGVSDVKRVESLIGVWNVVDKRLKVNLYYLFRISIEMIKRLIKF